MNHRLQSLSLLCCVIAGCDDRASLISTTQSTTMSSTAGMTKYPYLAADGGPHLLLPADVASAWPGALMVAALSPTSDYGRACSATAKSQMAKISVGGGSALAFADPPMTSWGHSADGLAEIYYLGSWGGTNLDQMIDNATAAFPTASLRDSGEVLVFEKPDAYLLFAGDTPQSTAYGVHTVKIAPGKYRILVGTHAVQKDSVTVYRLQPFGP